MDHFLEHYPLKFHVILGVGRPIASQLNLIFSPTDASESRGSIPIWGKTKKKIYKTFLKQCLF